MKLFNSKLFILIFLFLLVGGIWYLASYIKPVSNQGDQAKDSQQSASAPSEVVASSSAEPSGLLTRTSKNAEGIFRKVEGDSLFMSNAYEDRSFKLAPSVSITLMEVQEVTDPKATPEPPVISTIQLEDLQEYDQITLTLEKTGEEYLITQIYATRNVK